MTLHTDIIKILHKTAYTSMDNKTYLKHAKEVISLIESIGPDWDSSMAPRDYPGVKKKYGMAFEKSNCFLELLLEGPSISDNPIFAKTITDYLIQEKNYDLNRLVGSYLSDYPVPIIYQVALLEDMEYMKYLLCNGATLDVEVCAGQKLIDVLLAEKGLGREMTEMLGFEKLKIESKNEKISLSHSIESPAAIQTVRKL